MRHLGIRREFRMSDETTLAKPSESSVTCPNCFNTYDARTVPFCDCLTQARTPRCPHCGLCICKLLPDQQRVFWHTAPELLYRRRLAAQRESQAATGSASGRSLKRPLVLVAEDEPTTRTVAQRVLERIGYGVLLADRGDVAYQLVVDEKPDLVLTDALMPKIDGRVLCLKLKSAPETAGIKIVVMTALYTKSKDRDAVLTNFKADAFLKKPIEFKELEAVLTELVPVHP